MAKTTSSPSADRPPRHLLLRPLWMREFRRRYRWLIRIALAVPLFLVIAAVVLTRTAVTRIIVMDQLGGMLHVDAQADSAYVRADGRLIIDRARFRIPGVAGPAAQFVNVARVEADVDWWSGLSGGLVVRGLRLIEPVVTISQSLEDRSLNVASLIIPDATGGAGEIPAIILERAGIQVGEHTAERFSLLRHVVMDGAFTPVVGTPDAYTFKLRETRVPRGAGDEGGFEVSGDLTGGRVQVRLDNFSLDDWPPASVPTPVRGIFQELDLQGDVPSASLVYTPADGIAASLHLAGVAMNLPIEPDMTLPGGPPGEQQFGPPPRLMRMHSVSGEITFARESVEAAVNGVVEDLPYRVVLKYDGIEEDSPFTLDFESRGFRVERNPNLLPYAPQEVRRWLQTFSSPVATVDTKMRLSRGSPQGPPGARTSGEIAVEGELELNDGVASYAKFPYAFQDLSGRFLFDNDSITIERITGRSPSGGVLVADGHISPLDETSEVTINVDVRDVPIDDAMEAAFGPGRGQVIRSLFSRERHQQLLDAGLVQSPETAAAASRELEEQKLALASAGPDRAPQIASRIAALEARLRIPAFEFRGRADVKVRVHAPKGKGSEYHNAIDISLPSAGLVPDKFPLPIRATNVTIRVDDEHGRLTGGTFRALGGGAADVQASFTIPSGDRTDTNPRIEITAFDLPVDDLLINALPGVERPGSAQGPEQGGGAAVKRILRDMNIEGSGSGRVLIAERQDEPGAPLGFDADFGFSGASLAPDPWPGAGPIAVSGVSGRLTASERKLHAEFTGQAAAPGAPGPAAAGPVRAAIDATFGTQAAPGSTYRAVVACPGLDLHAPVESIIGVFSPGAAGQILRLRTEHAPEGAADVDALVESGVAGGPPRVRVEMSSAGDLALVALGRRVDLRRPAGRVVVAAHGPVVLACSGFIAPMSFGGEPAGTLMIEGEYPLTGHNGAAPGRAPGGPLRVSLKGGRFESTLVAGLLEAGTSADNLALFRSYQPRGTFDAAAEISPADAAGGTAGPLMRGSLEPRDLEVVSAGEPVRLEEMTGSVEFEGGSGQLRGLGGRAADWSFVVDGAWDTSASGVRTLRSQWSASGAGLTPDLRAALPAELRSVLDQIDVRVEGPFRVEDAALTVARGPRPADNATIVGGDLDFADGAASVGAELRGVTGRMGIAFQKEGELPPRYRLDVRADALRLAGVSVTEGRAVVHSGDGAGEVLVPVATGESYGGRVSAHAHLYPDASDPLGPRRFEADARLSGVRFSPLLDEITAQFKPPGRAASPGVMAARRVDAGDQSRGIMDAEFSIQGRIGRPETRRGRGSVRISGGRILSFPFMTRMIEVSNLTLPGNARLDYATGSFYLDGGLITFDDLAILSKAVQILGYGTMTWPEKILDLRFNSRAARPIPVLSELLQGIRDELITTTVRGRLGEHEVRLQQFPGARRMAGRSGGESQDVQSRRMSELRRRSASGGKSIAPSPRPPPHPPPSDPRPARRAPNRAARHHYQETTWRPTNSPSPPGSTSTPRRPRSPPTRAPRPPSAAPSVAPTTRTSPPASTPSSKNSAASPAPTTPSSSASSSPPASSSSPTGGTPASSSS